MRRTPNFTFNEKATFVDLILSYPILTAVRTQVADKRDINKKKDAAWCKLAEEFNAIGIEVYRDVEKLKRLWKNIKANAKTAYNKIVREQTKTGGGATDMQSSEPGMMAIYKKIIRSIPNQTISLNSQYDDDAPPFSSGSRQNESSSHSSEIGETSVATSQNASYSKPNEVGETSTATDSARKRRFQFRIFAYDAAPNLSSDISSAYAIISKDNIVSSQSQISSSSSQIPRSSCTRSVLGHPQRDKENQPRSKEGIRKRKIDVEELTVEVLQAKIKQINAQTRLVEYERGLKEVQLKMMKEEHSAKMSLLKNESVSPDALDLT